MLFLKRASDQFEARGEEILAEQLAKGRNETEAQQRAEHPDFYTEEFFVPLRARWAYLHDEVHNNVGDALNKALGALEGSNTGLEGVLHHIDFTRTIGKSRLLDKRLRDLIRHFNKHRLRNEDFEFPDLLGAAYEYLIGQFADSAGKKGGEFYTPRSVVRMMVRIAQPQEGMQVYDPCSGSGGMLILSRDYLTEHGGNPHNLGLHGQEDNGAVWSISKMNMILHGILDADLRNGDTLADPLHKQSGELMRFDRVITNPPFSQNYSREGLSFPERFAYGFCRESGKKADLMFVQHMVAVLRPGGMVCTVMPHGVLFRGGAEKDIRAGFINDDLLEAVIGLAPNLFYGTGIPACILVIRARDAKAPERRGKVLFINADAELRTGRAQNYLDPEHIEKIVSAYVQYDDIPGFATVVTHEQLADNDYNLNIRRYADNAPPPEPHDVRAHLLGGVPKTEVESSRTLFDTHGFDPMDILVERNSGYFDFAPDLEDKSDLKASVEGSAAVQGQEQALSAAFNAWWLQHEHRVIGLPETKDLMGLRANLLESFSESLAPVGLLDRFQVAGAVATWWGEAVFDLKTLMARGFDGVVESWVTTIVTALNDDQDKSDPLEHKLVKKLVPEYLDEIARADTNVAALISEKAEFEAGNDDGGDEDADGEADNYGKRLEAQIKSLKSEHKDALKRLAALTKTTPTGKPLKGSIAWMQAQGMHIEPEQRELGNLQRESDPVRARLETLEKEVAPYKAVKRQLSVARKKAKALKIDFAERLTAAQTGLPHEAAQTLVLSILKADLGRELERRVVDHRACVVSAVESWWDKYRVTLRDIEGRREDSKARLDGFLTELSYGE